MKIRQATKQGWIEWPEGGVADCSYPTSKLRRARVQGGGMICPTLQAGEKEIYFQEREDIEMINYRIRKLTPNECTRLMGFEDKDYEAMSSKNSATQCYKQAGNAIVVNVLMAIYGQLIPGKENTYKTYKQDFFNVGVDKK